MQVLNSDFKTSLLNGIAYYSPWKWIEWFSLLVSFQERKQKPPPHLIFQHFQLSPNTAEASVYYMRFLMNCSTVLGFQ